MSTVATIHPALVAVRQTPEYAELLAEFQLAASQVYGGEGWRARQRKAQSMMLRLERVAIELWDAAR